MSRTEKDQPWWLQAEWWEPRHLLCQHDTRRYGRPARPCDLPARPILSRDAPRAGVGGFRRNRCCWWPVWPFRCTCSYCRPRYSYAERPAHTAYARHAIAEHRATGRVDREPPTRGGGQPWCDW